MATPVVNAGIVIGNTRLVYHAQSKESSLSVVNKDKSKPYLIQSWVDYDTDGVTHKAPFVITPPLFRLEGEKENILRIMHVKSASYLPKDRESLFWINVKSIAASEKKDSNQLHISVKSRLKLFYRPKDLSGDPLTAYQKLKVNKNGSMVELHNPTPYYVSLFSLKVGNYEIKESIMIAPFESEKITLPKNIKPTGARWSAINDFGTVTKEFSIDF